MNQIEPNNQVLPTNISTNPGGKKSNNISGVKNVE